MRPTITYLFPAFTMRQGTLRAETIPGYIEELQLWLDRGRRRMPIVEAKILAPETTVLPDALEDDVQAHVACYVDSVVSSRLLVRAHQRAGRVAGYSMGLFAALCHAGSLSFEDGLWSVAEICRAAHAAGRRKRYGMGVVIGLTAEEVSQKIASADSTVEIADRCAPRVIACAGPRREVETLLEVCAESGALSTKMIPVNLPFHTSHLRPVLPVVSTLVDRLDLRPPRCGVISAITQRTINSIEGIREEIIQNVARPMNWYATMLRLTVDNGVLFECGLSDSLATLLRRNVRGGYRVLSLGSIASPVAAPG